MTTKVPEWNSLKSTALVVLLWIALASVIQVSHARIIALTARSSGTAGGAALIPRGAVLKSMSLGYDQLLADVWWLAFIQYYGDVKARTQDHCPLAYSYLDLITRLDPKFVQPYWFAAFAVGSEARRPDQAAEIIERGVQANQDDWYLPFIAGINKYLFAHDDQAAAKYYRMASKFPDAPKFLAGQVDILQARLPSYLKEIATWAQIYKHTEDKLVKEEAAARLRHLWLTVYRSVPGKGAKDRAVTELKALGVANPDEESL